MNCCDDKISSYSSVGAHFKSLHMFMDQLLNFGDELMKNFLAMHRSVRLNTLLILYISSFYFYDILLIS